MHLSSHEIRVLGVLMEREMTTPEYYPLSLNAVQAAANQRSSRDPVLTLAEEDIRQALHGLQELGLVASTRDTRVPKYEHRARTVLNLRRDENAVLCLLLLRGPQTPGELRARADRLHAFEDIAAVTAAVDRLAGRPSLPGPDVTATPNETGPLAAMLPRQPGSRESRYAHLLGELPDSASPASGFAEVSGASAPETLAVHSAELASIRFHIASLEQRLARLERSAETPGRDSPAVE